MTRLIKPLSSLGSKVFNTASLDTWKYIKVKCKVFVPYALIASTMEMVQENSKKTIILGLNHTMLHISTMKKGDQLSSDIESFILS